MEQILEIKNRYQRRVLYIQKIDLIYGQSNRRIHLTMTPHLLLSYVSCDMLRKVTILN